MTGKNYIRIALTLALLIFGVYWVVWVWPDLSEFFAECSAQGYSQDRYLATCSSKKFGDYEHGAFSYEIESRAIKSLREAQVLFFGNSRLQYALSNSLVNDFFNSKDFRASFYLFGFGYAEPFTYMNDLYHRFQLRPKAVVVGVDGRLFEPHLSDVARFMKEDPESRMNYKGKKWMQWGHWLVCGSGLPLNGWIDCGHLKSVFRSRTNGMWDTRFNFEDKSIPFTITPIVDLAKVTRVETSVVNFVEDLGVPKECVIFISVPYAHWNPGSTIELAKRAGVVNIETEVFEGWASVDGDHLTPASAERYSRMILPKLKPILEKCLRD